MRIKANNKVPVISLVVAGTVLVVLAAAKVKNTDVKGKTLCIMANIAKSHKCCSYLRRCSVVLMLQTLFNVSGEVFLTNRMSAPVNLLFAGK